MAGSVEQPADHARQGLPHGGVGAGEVRAEVRQPGGEERRDEIAGGPGDEHHPVAVGGGVDGAAGGEPTEVGQRAAGRRDGVRRDEHLAGHDVGQPRGQAGEEEPVDGEGREDEEVEGDADLVARHEEGDDEEQDGAHEVADREDLPARPPVEEHADEGTEDGEGQEDGREAGGDGARARGPFGGEQDGRGQGDLEDTVRGLGQQPHREEPAEAAEAHQDGEVPEEGHAAQPKGASGRRCAGPIRGGPGNECCVGPTRGEP